jgi:hypothetical protein
MERDGRQGRGAAIALVVLTDAGVLAKHGLSPAGPIGMGLLDVISAYLLFGERRSL